MQSVKRAFRMVFGFTLLAVGIVMLATPGPGWLVLLGALGVLAADFAWARRLLAHLKQQSQRLKNVGFSRLNKTA